MVTHIGQGTSNDNGAVEYRGNTTISSALCETQSLYL